VSSFVLLDTNVLLKRRIKMKQSQKMVYQAIDEDTGKEVIGIEIRRGMMDVEQMKKDEAILLPTLVAIIQESMK